MNFELAEDHRMIADLVGRFVDDELMPLEASVLAREATGGGLTLSREETARIDAVSKTLGLWGRTTKALGKLLAGMVTLPDRPQARRDDRDYPIFPSF